MKSEIYDRLINLNWQDFEKAQRKWWEDMFSADPIQIDLAEVRQWWDISTRFDLDAEPYIEWIVDRISGMRSYRALIAAIEFLKVTVELDTSEIMHCQVNNLSLEHSSVMSGKIFKSGPFRVRAEFEGGKAKVMYISWAQKVDEVALESKSPRHLPPS